MREIAPLLYKSALVVTVSCVSLFATPSITAIAESNPPSSATQALIQGPENIPIDSYRKAPEGRRSKHKLGGHILQDTAKLIGIEQNELISELKQGKSLLQIVQARKGWTEDQYIQKLMPLVIAHIEKAEAEGTISKEKAQTIKTKLPSKLKHIVNRTWKIPSQGHPVHHFHNMIRYQYQP